MGQSPGVYMQKMACLSWVEIRLFHLKQVVSSKWCKRRLAEKINLQLLISKIPLPYNVHLLTKKNARKSDVPTQFQQIPPSIVPICFLSVPSKCYPFLQYKQ